MQTVENQLRKILDAMGGERPVHAFLKQNTELLVSELYGTGFYYSCIPEFQFGADFRADFLLLRPDSPGWHAYLVELESPDVLLYTKRGTPTRALSDAQKQILDWRDWVRKYESYFRSRLAEVIDSASDEKKMEMKRHFRPTPRHDIYNMNALLQVDYVIVIGRSSLLSDQNLNRLSLELRYGERSNIMTYDRLLRQATFLDEKK